MTAFLDSPIYIVAARRTPIGSMSGALSDFSAPQLGAAAIRAVLADCRLDGGLIDEVFMGCVLPAGLGQAPARQAARQSGLPDTVGATTFTAGTVTGVYYKEGLAYLVTDYQEVALGNVVQVIEP